MNTKKPVSISGTGDGDASLKDGMVTSSSKDFGHWFATVVAGLIISKLVERGFVTSQEVSYISGFLPSAIYFVIIYWKKKIKQRKNIKVALMMPQDSTVAELKAVLQESDPIAVLSANKDEVVVVKEVEKEE